MPPPLGTSDGSTPSSDGVRVVFESGPHATGGSGSVAVLNADSTAFFTTVGQPYFQYDGILAQGDTSSAREWRFSVPPGVSHFAFTVFVAAPVRAEEGWVSIAPLGPSLMPGDTMQLSATVRNAGGGVAAGAAVGWTSSDPGVVTVGPDGLLTAIADGTATVTATSGSRSGAVRVWVFESPIGTMEWFDVMGGSLTAGGQDTVWFRAADRQKPGLPQAFVITLRSPADVESELRCFTHTWVGDTLAWSCPMVLPAGVLGGAWRIRDVRVTNRTVTHAELLAAGAPAHVFVRSDNEDRTPPVLDSLRLMPDTVTAGEGHVTVQVKATDDRPGASRAYLRIRSEGNPSYWLAPQNSRWEHSSTRFEFAWAIPAHLFGGTFRIDSLQIWDGNNNRLEVGRTALRAAGFETDFTVINENPDTVAPVITAFSFTPSSVAGNEADTVTVTLSAWEPAEQSGVWFLDMMFDHVGGAAPSRRCLLSGTTLVHTRTLTCRIVFSATDAGTWNVRYIRAIDFMNNSRVLFRSDLEAVPYPTTLTVRAP
jgi:hypothetical protein